MIIKTNTTADRDESHTNFCGVIVPEAVLKCESFTVISIDFLPGYENKYYLQVYLQKCYCKIVDK